MKVKEIMTTDVLTLPLNTTLIKAAKFLATHNISGAPVVNQKGELIGLVSEKDIFKALYPTHAEFYESPGVWIDLDSLEDKTRAAADKPVDEFMSKEVVTVNADASLMQVGSIMLVRGIHRVVIIGQDNRIEGIVTRRDIYQKILKKSLKI